MLDRNSYRRFRSIAHFVIALAVLSTRHQANAQSTTESTGEGLPDAIILVAPVGDEATVAVTYSRPVPHAQARKSLERLAAVSGWRLGKTTIKDQELFGASDTGERRSLGKQTGIEANASHVALMYGTAFRLQPYVDAYRDLNRIDLLFYTGGVANFTGLRFFNDPAVRVELLQDGGPYRYRLDIRSHSGALPKLPLDQPAPPVQPEAAVQGSIDSGEQKPLPLGSVFVIATCAGIAAFASLRLLSIYQSRGHSRPRPGSGRPLQSGPYIVTRRKD